jgi:hypothetical protein
MYRFPTSIAHMTWRLFGRASWVQAEAAGPFREVGHSWPEAILATTYPYDGRFLTEPDTIALLDVAEATPDRAREENVDY